MDLAIDEHDDWEAVDGEEARQAEQRMLAQTAETKPLGTVRVTIVAGSGVNDEGTFRVAARVSSTTRSASSKRLSSDGMCIFEYARTWFCKLTLGSLWRQAPGWSQVGICLRRARDSQPYLGGRLANRNTAAPD